MSDPDLEVIQTTAVLEESAEMKTWAHRLMDGVREVQKLHTPQPYETEDGQVVGCLECSRVADDVVESWPCATAIALGIEEGPLL